MTRIKNKLPGVLLSFCASYVLLGMLGGTLWFWAEGGVVLVAPRWWLSVAVFTVVLYAVSSFIEKKAGGEALPRCCPEMFLLVFGVYLLTDAVSRPFTFFLNEGTRLDVLVAGLVGAFLLWRFGAGSRESAKSGKWLLLLVMVQLVLSAFFLKFTAGRLIFSDDHPPFLYRIFLLRDHFPWIPFYNIAWNAGYSAHEFFPSGMLNFYLLSLPILLFAGNLAEVQNSAVYTLLIPYVFVFIVPFSVYAASRLLGLDNRSSCFAAIFAIGPSTGFFEFMLKYGTMGFSVSVGLTPLAVACAYRLAISERTPSWRHACYLLISASLVMTWSLSSFFLLPTAAYGLFLFRTVFSPERRLKVVVFLLLFLLLNGPWMMIFIKESRVFSFLSGNTLPGSTSSSILDARGKSALVEVAAKGPFAEFKKNFKQEINRFREILSKVNPVLVFFFLPGLYFFPSKRTFYLFSSSILWLWLLAALGNLVKPQLELHRMIIPASYLMTVAAGAGISGLMTRLWEGIEQGRAWLPKLLRSSGAVLLMGALAVSPLVAGAGYVNRSDEKYVFAPKEAETLSGAIRQYGGDGRTFFLGFILQELGASHWAAQDGGHIAMLAAFSGKPMYALDYYHRRWSTVDPIPLAFRKRSIPGIEEFLDLVNATAVVTFKREWADYCLRTPGYRQVYFEGRFRVFAREHAVNSYFLEGSGKISPRSEGFRVFPEAAESVLKFRYLPRLRSEPKDGVEISPVFAFSEELGGGKQEDVYYIRLKVSPKVLASGKGVALGFWPKRE